VTVIELEKGVKIKMMGGTGIGIRSKACRDIESTLQALTGIHHSPLQFHFFFSRFGLL